MLKLNCLIITNIYAYIYITIKNITTSVLLFIYNEIMKL